MNQTTPDQQIPAVVDIDAMAAVMEHHAERLDAEAEPFFDTAKQLMTSAQQAADQVMAEAKARAAKLLHDAQARADEETGKGLVKQAEATYWRGLATRERDAGAVNQTRPDQQPAGRNGVAR